jgi:hypothetical protein
LDLLRGGRQGRSALRLPHPTFRNNNEKSLDDFLRGLRDFNKMITLFYTDSTSNLRFAACLPEGKTSFFFASCRALLN